MGLDLSTKRSDLIRAAMEGIGFAMRVCLEHLNKLGAKPEDLLLAGGGSKSPLWCQIFADCLKLPTKKSNIDEQAAALGAAAVAAVGIGMWKDFDKIDSLHKIEERYQPDEKTAKLYDQLFEAYEKACDGQSDLGDMLAKIN